MTKAALRSLKELWSIRKIHKLMIILRVLTQRLENGTLWIPLNSLTSPQTLSCLKLRSKINPLIKVIRIGFPPSKASNHEWKTQTQDSSSALPKTVMVVTIGKAYWTTSTSLNKKSSKDVPPIYYKSKPAGCWRSISPTEKLTTCPIKSLKSQRLIYLINSSRTSGPVR